MKNLYIIGHNPNSIKDVQKYLSSGANAIEPDINIISGTTKLCVSHDEGDQDTITIDDYFSQVAQLKEYPNLSLIYLDCKPGVVGRGQEILQCIRKYMGKTVKIVLSVASLKEALTMFRPSLIPFLQENESLLIDEENDPLQVSNFFRAIGAERFGYGNGDSVPLVPTTIFFPHIVNSIKEACTIRDNQKLGFVFTWTFNSKFNQKRFLDMGVDGIIVDIMGFPCISGLQNIIELLSDKE